MEERKQKEIEHYDAHAREWLEQNPDDAKRGDFEGFDPRILKSFRFCYALLKKEIKGKKVLDYGCGNGVHLPFLAEHAAEVVAIDLSGPSLAIAAERLKKSGHEKNVSLVTMDCEKLDFPDNSFDMIFDGGTFSSIDLDRALPELARVLKPGGCLIGIETLGHNPLANLNRVLNKKSGKRTEWAASHIVRISDVSRIKKYFDDVTLWFFHPLSFLAFPLLSIPGGQAPYQIFELLDALILAIPPLRRYAFKTVFILQSPRK